MMYFRNGKPLMPGMSWTDEAGMTHPCNWASVWDSATKVALGISEAPDPEPKLEDVQAQKIQEAKTVALLSIGQSDWKITRAVEELLKIHATNVGDLALLDVIDAREAIRAECNAKEAAILSAASVAEGFEIKGV